MRTGSTSSHTAPFTSLCSRCVCYNSAARLFCFMVSFQLCPLSFTTSLIQHLFLMLFFTQLLLSFLAPLSLSLFALAGSQILFLSLFFLLLLIFNQRPCNHGEEIACGLYILSLLNRVLLLEDYLPF